CTRRRLAATQRRRKSVTSSRVRGTKKGWLAPSTAKGAGGPPFTCTGGSSGGLGLDALQRLQTGLPDDLRDGIELQLRPVGLSGRHRPRDERPQIGGLRRFQRQDDVRERADRVRLLLGLRWV